MVHLQLGFTVCKKLCNMLGLVSEGEQVSVQSLGILKTAHGYLLVNCVEL